MATRRMFSIHLKITETLLGVTCCRQICISSVSQIKKKIDITKFKDAQTFHRTSEALYGPPLKPNNVKAVHQKHSKTMTAKLMEKESQETLVIKCEKTDNSNLEDGNRSLFVKVKDNSNRSDDSNEETQDMKHGSAVHFTKKSISNNTKLKPALALGMTLEQAIASMSNVSLQGVSEENDGISEEINKYLSGMKRNPSVGAILQETMSEDSKAALEHWMKNMIEKLGEQGFHDYKQNLFSNGHNFHAYLASQLTKVDGVDLKPENEPLLESLGNLLRDITDVELVESRVSHHQLGYMGILDGVIRYRDELVLVEWKTADKEKRTLDQTYDNPLQVAAYMGALNSSQQLQVSRGLLVIAYRDGKPATIHPMSSEKCLHYWQFWLFRLQKYWKTKLNME